MLQHLHKSDLLNLQFQVHYLRVYFVIYILFYIKVDDDEEDEEEEEEGEEEEVEEEIEVEVEVDSDGNEIMNEGDEEGEDTFFGDPIPHQEAEEVKPRTMSMEFLGESLSSNNGSNPPDAAELEELGDLDFGAADKMKPKVVRPKNVPPPPKGMKGKPAAGGAKGKISGLDDFKF